MGFPESGLLLLLPTATSLVQVPQGPIHLNLPVVLFPTLARMIFKSSINYLTAWLSFSSQTVEAPQPGVGWRWELFISKMEEVIKAGGEGK